MNIIIPAAGLGKRMKSYGPKALIPVANDEPLIIRQIRLLRQVYPTAKMIVVTGFEADRVRRVLPKDVSVVVNQDFETTNVAVSIALGLAKCPSGPTLVVYGDLVFTHDALSCLASNRSQIVVDYSNTRSDEVGVNIVNGKAMCFSYGLKDKWAHIMMLQSKEASLFMSLANEGYRRRHFSYEVLNDVLDCGGTIYVTENKKMILVEIDSSKDIEPATKIA